MVSERHSFQLSDDFVRVPAEFVSENYIVCVSPEASREAFSELISLHVSVNGEDFSDGIDYHFYKDHDVARILPEAGLPYNLGGNVTVALGNNVVNRVAAVDPCHYLTPAAAWSDCSGACSPQKLQ